MHSIYRYSPEIEKSLPGAMPYVADVLKISAGINQPTKTEQWKQQFSWCDRQLDTCSDSDAIEYGKLALCARKRLRG